MKSTQSIYDRVTSKILADLEHGVRPWSKPWTTSSSNSQITLPRRHCGTPYRGVNILLLWTEALEKGYTAPTWMTYRQATELGGQVRKSEHGSLVVYANNITRNETSDAGEEVERQIPFMRGYTVFNVEQIENLPAQYYPQPLPQRDPVQLIENAEAFFQATGAIVRHGGNQAFYAPGPDIIQLPHPEAFKDVESYSAVKGHELTHWTSHPSRLARALGKRFGDEQYAAEELVAEIGSALLCATLGISFEVREDHAAYLNSWLKILKSDSRAIFTAASLAQRAVDFLESLQKPKEAAA